MEIAIDPTIRLRLRNLIVQGRQHKMTDALRVWLSDTEDHCQVGGQIPVSECIRRPGHESQPSHTGHPAYNGRSNLQTCANDPSQTGH